MSSEAAYFPNLLSRGEEAREAACDLTEMAVRLEAEATEPQGGADAQVSEASDEQLLAQVRDGEKEALVPLFRRHARAVRNVACRILRDEAEADDLVQDVFLFIFRKAALYDSGRGKAANWIIHVAYHRAFDRRRYLNTRHFYASRELKEAGLHLAGTRASFHHQSIEGILGKQLLVRFNARLTPEQRETIQLYFFEGYALKEIAELTGRSLVNVRSHYYRGLERLRKYVLPEKLRSK